jgi:hypothetical protein
METPTKTPPTTLQQDLWMWMFLILGIPILIVFIFVFSGYALMPSA